LTYIPFILVICRSSHLFKIIGLFDKVIRFYPIFDLSNNKKQPIMKNETKLNYTTLHFAIDDLELINQALCRLLIYTKNENKKSELNRMIWQLSQAINPELYEGSDSQLMNS
jgi:hypothetical protein